MLCFINFLSYQNCCFENTTKLVNSFYRDDLASSLFDFREMASMPQFEFCTSLTFKDGAVKL